MQDMERQIQDLQAIVHGHDSIHTTLMWFGLFSNLILLVLLMLFYLRIRQVQKLNDTIYRLFVSGKSAGNSGTDK